ncbi:hypothetical protein N8089_04240 [Flavobacteriales bacterium]|nr:hypothetical protein [Flavobacteriales bacterium]
MKKTFYILLIIFSSNLNAQDNSIAPDFNGVSTELFATYQFNHQPGNGLTIPFYGFGIYPRYNFLAQNNYLSLAVGSPFNGGFDFVASNAGSIIQYFIDLPAELTLNFGERATTGADYYIGGYVGGGFGYNYAVYSDSFGFKAKSSSFGPMVSAGIRYKYMGRPVGIRVSYTVGYLNNFKEDPCNCLTYENGTIPKILNLSFAYGVQ